MPDMEYFAGLGQSWNRSVANHAGNLSERLNLKERLNFILWLAVRRVTGTETVVCERMVAPGEGIIDIRIIKVVVGEIPIAKEASGLAYLVICM